MFNKVHAALAKTHTPFVFALPVKHSLKSIAVTLYECTACGTEAMLNHTASPCCPACGEDAKALSDKEMEVPVKDVTKELSCVATVKGKNFKPFNIFISKANHKALAKTQMYCPLTASIITISEPTVDSDDADDMDAKDPTAVDNNGMPTPDQNDDQMAAGEDKSEDDGIDTAPDASDDDDDSSDEEDGQGPDGGINEDTTQDDEPAKTMETPAEARVIKTKSHANLLKINLLEKYRPLLQAKKQVASFVFASGITPKWHVIVEDKTIATTNFDKLSKDLKNSYVKASFAKVFAAATENGITDEVVKDFGLEPTIISQPVDKAVANSIKFGQKQTDQLASKKLKEMRASFEQAVGIAAMGINKGSFGQSHKLRDTLVSQLKSINVRNPGKFVDRILASTINEYIGSIIEKAAELQTETPEALNAVAKMVQTAGFSFENDSDSDGTDLSEKLGRVATPQIATVLENDAEDNGVKVVSFANVYRRMHAGF